MNRVPLGLVKQPRDRDWSSARWYHGDRAVPLQIDDNLL